MSNENVEIGSLAKLFKDELTLEICERACKTCAYSLGLNQKACAFRSNNDGYCEDISTADEYLSKVLKKIASHIV